MNEPLVIAGRPYRSRLLVGTGKYRDFAETRAAIDASGADFLAALVIGSDVMCRLGAAARHPHRGFHYTSAFGVFGAAAAASRLLRLDAARTRHALGIAFIQACGTQQANIEPSLTKRMLSAFAARAGVYAALLAQRGITAPSEVFE